MMEKKNAGICYLMGLTNIWGAALVVKLAISAAKMAFIAISDTDIVIVIMFHVKLGGAVRWRRFWMFDGLRRSFQRVNRLSAGVRHSQVARIIIMPTFGWGPKRDANWLKNIFRCRLYATSGNGEQVYDSFSLPSACLCHFRCSWSPSLKKSPCIIKPIFFLIVQGLSLKLDPFQHQEGKQYNSQPDDYFKKTSHQLVGPFFA